LNYVDPSGHCRMDAKADDCFVSGKTKIPSDPVARSEGTNKLIDFSKKVKMMPMQVIRLGIAHEIGGWASNSDTVELYAQHLRNRYVEYAKGSCGGNLTSNNCYLNFFTSNFQTIRTSFVHNYNESGDYGSFYFNEDKIWDDAYKDAADTALNNFWTKLNPDYSYGNPKYGREAYRTGIFSRSDWNVAFGGNKVSDEKYNQYVLAKTISSCNGQPGYSVILSGDGSYYVDTAGLTLMDTCK